MVFDEEVDADLTVLDRLAEREAGRWNAEQLADSWVYSKERNLEDKTSPHVVPWEKLPDNVERPDRDPFLKWPEVLGDLGLKVVRIQA